MRFEIEGLESRRLLSVISPSVESNVPATNLSAVAVATKPASPSTGVSSPLLPVGVSDLSAETMSSAQVLISWTNFSAGSEPTINNVTSIQVLRSEDNVNFNVIKTLDPTATNFTDSGLTASTQYYYMIATTNSAGNSADSAVISATTAVVILPGAGFTGPTVPNPTVQNVNPTQTGFDEPAIANWDVVPYQTFSGLFNVGVVAFHMNGIKEVDFSVNGGAWTKVTQMTLNPQTANQIGVGNASAGVTEYWATLDASTFATDGQIEVRAIAYPTNGQALVLNSLWLNTDARNTLPSLSVYVSPTGSDTTGDGTAANPFASIARAANYYSSAYGGTNTPIDGATICLEPGTYQLTSVVYPEPITSTAWLTVTTAPGVLRSQVVIAGNGGATINNWGLRTQLMHFENLTFAPQAASEQSIFRSTAGTDSSLWIDGCVLIGPGRTVSAEWSLGIPTAFTYLTDSSESSCRDGIPGNLVRDVTVANIGSDAFSGSETVINSSVTGTNNAGTTFHPDVYQFYAPAGSTISNVILYGVTASIGGSYAGQGFFSGNNVSISDVAFVDCNINNQEQPGNVANVFMFGGPTTNLYVLDCTFTGGALWRTDFHFVASDVVLDDTTFSSPPQPEPGVTVLQ